MKKSPESIQYTVKEIAEILNCPFKGDGNTIITGVAIIEKASGQDIVFASGKKHLDALKRSKAGAAILPPCEEAFDLPVIICENPYLSFAEAISLFHHYSYPLPGIHPQAFVSPSAKIGKDVSIGAFSYIGEDAEIGTGSIIFPLVSIYPGVKIGSKTVVHSHVSIRENTVIGNRVIIHNGVVLGADGFGYTRDKDGNHIKIPQIGKVIIEDDVEIGANSAVDRAGLEETRICKGTKVDNLVQIAHNVTIGPGSIIAGQAGIAGSSKLGKNVILGGQVGISDHVNVGDNAIMAAKSGITKDIPEGSFISGSPHLDIMEWRKAWASIPHLHQLLKDFRKLKKQVEELSNKIYK
jgi:UDP-3-O-[3-hydroxymyristoyl] glucosamine N-acyltransferase